jgi:hypothetical protein
MNTQFALGTVVGLGIGVALYFLVVWLLPILGRTSWILT